MVGIKATFPSFSIHFQVVKYKPEMKNDILRLSLHTVLSESHSRVILLRLNLEFINKFVSKTSVQNAGYLWQCGLELIHYFSKTNSFIHWECSILSFHTVLLSKIVFCEVQKQNGELIFRKIDIIHEWHIISWVAKKPVDFNNSGCN